ncbi:MAG: hypothetical protein IJA61_02270 [Clostridia bacterium]|nr:hypothetical protein [Clostridia bacterium]
MELTSNELYNMLEQGRLPKTILSVVGENAFKSMSKAIIKGYVGNLPHASWNLNLEFENVEDGYIVAKGVGNHESLVLKFGKNSIEFGAVKTGGGSLCKIEVGKDGSVTKSDMNVFIGANGPHATKSIVCKTPQGRNDIYHTMTATGLRTKVDKNIDLKSSFSENWGSQDVWANFDFSIENGDFASTSVMGIELLTHGKGKQGEATWRLQQGEKKIEFGNNDLNKVIEALKIGKEFIPAASQVVDSSISRINESIKRYENAKDFVNSSESGDEYALEDFINANEIVKFKSGKLGNQLDALFSSAEHVRSSKEQGE